MLNIKTKGIMEKRINKGVVNPKNTRLNRRPVGRLNEAEVEDVKPSLERRGFPLDYILQNKLFSSYAEFKSFLMTLSMDEFKTLYKGGSPMDLLVEIANISGVPISFKPKQRGGGKDGTPKGVYFPTSLETKEGWIKWDEEMSFAPLIVDEIPENASIKTLKDYKISILKPKWDSKYKTSSYNETDILCIATGNYDWGDTDSGARSKDNRKYNDIEGRLSNLTFEQYLESASFFKFGKRDDSDKIFSDMSTAYSKLNIQEPSDITAVINKLGKSPKEILAKSKGVTKDGETLSLVKSGSDDKKIVTENRNNSRNTGFKVMLFEEFSETTYYETMNESKNRYSAKNRLYENAEYQAKRPAPLFVLLKAGAIKDYSTLVSLILGMTGKEFKAVFDDKTPEELLLVMLELSNIPYQKFKINDDVTGYLPELTNTNNSGRSYYLNDVKSYSFSPFIIDTNKLDRVQDSQKIKEYRIGVATLNANKFEFKGVRYGTTTMGEYFSGSDGNNLWNPKETISNDLFNPLVANLKKVDIVPDFLTDTDFVLQSLSPESKKLLNLSPEVLTTFASLGGAKPDSEKNIVTENRKPKRPLADKKRIRKINESHQQEWEVSDYMEFIKVFGIKNPTIDPMSDYSYYGSDEELIANELNKLNGKYTLDCIGDQSDQYNCYFVIKKYPLTTLGNNFPNKKPYTGIF